MSTISILTKTGALDQGFKKTSVNHADDKRRGSSASSNGGAPPPYPGEQGKQVMPHENRPNVPHYQPNRPTVHQSPVGGHRVTPMDKVYGHEARRESATPRRKSLVDYVAPPIYTEEIPKCCFCLNIRIACIIIGCIELVLLAVALYGVCHWYIDTESDPEPSRVRTNRRFTPTLSRNGLLGGCIVAIILFFLAILCMFYGLWRKKTNCIVPHMVVQAFSVLGALAGIVVTSIAISVMRPKLDDDDPNDDDDLSDRNSMETYYFVVGILVFSIFVFIFEIYAFLVVRNCARFFNVDDQMYVVNEEMMERTTDAHGGPQRAWHTAH